jgi:DNA replication protein DnaC
MRRETLLDLATAKFIARHEDALFLGPPGSGKSHLAEAIGVAAIQQGYRVLYRETHTLRADIAKAALDGTCKQGMDLLSRCALVSRNDQGFDAKSKLARDLPFSRTGSVVRGSVVQFQLSI